jgi:Fic family protein
LRRTTFAKAIRGSNSIEGYNVTVEDAIAADLGDQPMDASDETWAAVVGYRNAMTCVLQVANDPHFQLSTDWIRGLQFMMIHYDLSKNPGKWRPGAIFVRNFDSGEIVYEAPPAAEVPGLMEELAQALRSPGTTPPIIQAAMGHLNLVMIHPFSDGNGRMGRCLQTLIMARNGTEAPVFSSIEEFLGRNTQDYYSVLAQVGAGAWHPDRDARLWLRFCLKAHYTQATTLLRRSTEYESLWNVLEAQVNRAGLPDRLVLALSDAAMNLAVRNSTYRGVAEISEQLASRDLKLGVDSGFLTPVGERRGRVYIASPQLKAIRKAVAAPKNVPDPFEEVEPALALRPLGQGQLRHPRLAARLAALPPPPHCLRILLTLGGWLRARSFPDHGLHDSEGRLVFILPELVATLAQRGNMVSRPET